MVRQFQQVSKGLLVSALKSLDDKLASGLRAEDALNQTSIELAYCSMSHMRAFVIDQFAKTLQKPTISVQLKSVLSLLFEIMALSWINKFGGDFVRFGGFQVFKKIALSISLSIKNFHVSGKRFCGDEFKIRAFIC